ncbi:MAG: cation:dicarboxylase symporter family transporter, partial [Chitinophagaceae bacterium]
MIKRNRLTFYILVAMVLGIAVGYFVHENAGPAFISSFDRNIRLLTTIFLRLVQMIIAPLVFST